MYRSNPTFVYTFGTVPRLRKENRKLREDRSNVLLYREQLRILEDVEKGANKTRERCAELEFDLNVITMRENS